MSPPTTHRLQGTRCPVSRRRAGAPAFALPAFTLIEVLIAVLILALGLLGLGAVFPVVIREQRIAADATLGVLASSAARAQLEGLRIPDANDGPFWAHWRVDDNSLDRLPRGSTSQDPSDRGYWFTTDMIDADTGDLTLGDISSDSQPDDHFVIPLRNRLYPRDGGAAVQPQFVWDLAVQRVPDGDDDPLNDPLRFAIFVRRLDARIRVPAGRTLMDVLTLRTAAILPSEWRVPVAVDTNGNPTQDGIGGTAGPNYSGPITVNVVFDYVAGDPILGRRDRLYRPTGLSTTDQVRWGLARQINQRLVDNLGNIYTVIELGKEGTREYVRISPEVPPSVVRATNATGSLYGRVEQVLFTPQVPAAVVMWTVNP